MVFRFLHIADLHLDTVFGGEEATRARLRQATRDAFELAVTHCIDEGLDALLIAGDAFDDGRFSISVQSFFLGQMQRLLLNGVHVFYVTGNHDPGSKGYKAADLGFADAPEEVGPTAGMWIYRKATPRATTLLNANGEPIAIVVGAGHSKPDVSANLASKFKRPSSDLPIVGLLHTQVESAQVASEHAKYAPSVEEDYAQVQFDYWALGHVHMRQQVFPDFPVYYSGNLQGRNPKEVGPKGGLQVEVRAGEPAEVTFVPLAPIEWHQVPVADLENIESRAALFEYLLAVLQEFETQSSLEASELCLRLLPSGPCPFANLLLQTQERDELAEELRDQSGLLEVQIRCREVHAPRELTDLLETPSVQREALLLLRSLAEDEEALLALRPKELPGADASVAATTEAQLQYLRERMQDLEEELLQRAFKPEAWQ